MSEQSPEEVARDIVNRAIYNNCLRCQQCSKNIDDTIFHHPVMPECYFDERTNFSPTNIDAGKVPCSSVRWASLDNALGKLPDYQALLISGEDNPNLVAIKDLMNTLKKNNPLKISMGKLMELYNLEQKWRSNS